MNTPKVVGQPCPTCQTPFIMGQKGAYCKPCYITWANQNKQKPNPNPGAPSNQPARDFNAEAFGKCKHAFLVEAYKKDIVVCDEVERTAEQWAEMSMRRLKDQKNGNYGSGDELDNIKGIN